MTKAIQIDPKTGLKIFNTKASLATQNIKGQGYSINSNTKFSVNAQYFLKAFVYHV